jgi:hypothetical protein
MKLSEVANDEQSFVEFLAVVNVKIVAVTLDYPSH